MRFFKYLTASIVLSLLFTATTSAQSQNTAKDNELEKIQKQLTKTLKKNSFYYTYGWYHTISSVKFKGCEINLSTVSSKNYDRANDPLYFSDVNSSKFFIKNSFIVSLSNLDANSIAYKPYFATPYPQNMQFFSINSVAQKSIIKTGKGLYDFADIKTTSLEKLYFVTDGKVVTSVKTLFAEAIQLCQSI